MAHETEAAAARIPGSRSSSSSTRAFDQEKQVADIEDLIAQGVDAIIVQPVTSTSANASIEKAVAAVSR